jgi:hypothetical protein
MMTVSASDRNFEHNAAAQTETKKEGHKPRQ